MSSTSHAETGNRSAIGPSLHKATQKAVPPSRKQEKLPPIVGQGQARAPCAAARTGKVRFSDGSRALTTTARIDITMIAQAVAGGGDGGMGSRNGPGGTGLLTTLGTCLWRPLCITPLRHYYGTCAQVPTSHIKTALDSLQEEEESSLSA
ncbi:unnamed protein product [Clonostachys solani]|uniref:Uncharacterized protein n=1 Tax=Clonostachys solani TaxID=160281 RepID=A0A9N9ZPK8_9HYPO|nr:unnamed protein product [Clonostachys solani]